MGTTSTVPAPARPLPGVLYPRDEEARAWFERGAWSRETIGAVVERAASESGFSTAVVDDVERLSYRMLEERSALVARRLLGARLAPGDRVLLQLGNDAAAVVAILGVFRAGLIPVCAVPQYRTYEMGGLARSSEASAHLVAPGAAGGFDLLGMARELREEVPSLRHVFPVGRHVEDLGSRLDLDGEAPEVELPSQPSPLDVAAFQLSGGTTDLPKIIPRHHGEYLGYAAAWADRLELTGDDVLLWPLPVSHNAGMLCFLLPALLRRACLALMPRFEPEPFLRTIEAERVTLTGSIGPIAPRLLDFEELGDFDLSSLRLFVTLDRAAELEAHLGTPAMNIFGITEGMLAASAPTATAAARHRTVGRPASRFDELRLLVPGEDREAEPGEVAELCFRGPSVLRAYYRNPASTAAAFTTDGFFRTGDLVRAHGLDGATHISFEGRAKDNIDRGGEKFGTEEIERLLSSHPAIDEARVVGMPDPYLGERVCAFVILHGSAAEPGLAELGDFLLERGLAKFKLPERIEVIEEMPTTRVGKLDRPALRRRIAEILRVEATT